MIDPERSARLRRYVCRQLDNLFPLAEGDTDIGYAEIVEAISRTDHCVSRIKAFRGSYFDVTNSGHYATFLYYLSYTLGREPEKVRDATRLFLLNKALNGIDLFYEIEMPPVFLIGHTVGMVFVKATYGSGCVFHQGCTVGRNRDSRPTLEAGVVLYPNASVIGACVVRENSVLSPGVQLINTDSPGNCLVFPGERGSVVFKPLDKYFADQYLVRD